MCLCFTHIIKEERGHWEERERQRQSRGRKREGDRRKKSDTVKERNPVGELVHNFGVWREPTGVTGSLS